jgi:hypothetical protein
MDRAMEEHARDARDLAGRAREVVNDQLGQSPTGEDALEGLHRNFVEVGRRWSELVPWQTLVGWGAFLAGVGVLLWGIGSISQRELEIYREVRASDGERRGGRRAIGGLAERARALVRR